MQTPSALRSRRRELHRRSAAVGSALASRGPEDLQPVIDEMNQLLARQRQQRLREPGPGQ